MRFVRTAWLNSLGVKVVLAYVAGAALSIGLVALLICALAGAQGDMLSGVDVEDSTRDMARELEFDSRGVPIGFNIDDFDFQWVFQSLKQETAYRVMDASGAVVLDSAAGQAFWPEDEAVRLRKQGRFEFLKDGVAVRGAAERVEHGGRAWYLQFAASTRFLHLVYRAFALPFTGVGIFLFSLVLLFVFAACAYVTLRYTFKPLRALSESAAAISPRSLHARLGTESIPTEIAPLVHSFNRVLERLEHGYRLQQEFLATAAHELKTPLALIRAQIELRPGGFEERASLLNDVEHMTRQVQQLLLLAEASEAQSYRFSEVDVLAVVEEATGYLQRMAHAAGVRLAVRTQAPGVQWPADRGAFFTLLKNLLENAIQHAPADTCVEVEIHRTALTVRDGGPGVDAASLPLLFDRFWRGAHRRDHGAGLGLAICQEIALAHGWRLAAERAEPGLRFRLSTGGETRGGGP